MIYNLIVYMESKRSSPDLAAMFKTDENGYVSFGDLSRRILKKQGQYGVRYAFEDAEGDYPNLGEGLRIIGDPGNYCDVKIHKDDIHEFVDRYNNYQKSRGL